MRGHLFLETRGHQDGPFCRPSSHNFSLRTCNFFHGRSTCKTAMLATFSVLRMWLPRSFATRHGTWKPTFQNLGMKEHPAAKQTESLRTSKPCKPWTSARRNRNKKHNPGRARNKESQRPNNPKSQNPTENDFPKTLNTTRYQKQDFKKIKSSKKRPALIRSIRPSA